jgi:hypothetical protein
MRNKIHITVKNRQIQNLLVFHAFKIWLPSLIGQTLLMQLYMSLRSSVTVAVLLIAYSFISDETGN